MTLPPLHHRLVRGSDRETLLAMRKECGWGMDRIDSYLHEPNMATYLFYRDSAAGEEVPVGMGCLTFDLPKDPDMASRERGIIAISKPGVVKSGPELIPCSQRLCVQQGTWIWRRQPDFQHPRRHCRTGAPRKDTRSGHKTV